MLGILRKGQSTAEYAIVIGLVIAVAVAMQVYVKRGLQAKIKDAVDYNENTTLFTTVQFEPDYLGSNMTSTRNASSTENMTTTGGVNRSSSEVSTRIGNQTISAVTP